MISTNHWLCALPARVAFVDVETTGFSPTIDRIVSLAVIRLETAELREGRFVFDFTHLVFNPGRRSHPNATAVHGYTDAMLSRQDPFARYASILVDFLEDADLIVAHNAEFDTAFIHAEVTRTGCSPPSRPVFCTVEGWHAAYGGSARLDEVCRWLGVGRNGSRHDALEDAWLAMIVYLSLHGCPFRTPFPAHRPDMSLVNLRGAPVTRRGR